MPEGLNGSADNEARRQVAEVRHELRNFMAVSDIKTQNLRDEFERSAKDVKEATIAAAKTVKEEGEKSAETIKTNFEVKHTELQCSLGKIESLLKWAGSLIVSLILGVLGWSLLQQVQSNEQQKKDLQSQIKLLEEQEHTRLLVQRNSEALGLPDPSAPKPTVTPVSPR